jgi:phosphoribosylglycinamide formyltransferase-1
MYIYHFCQSLGGKGIHGKRIHEAVIKSKEKKSGATVHFVDENYDTGKIIFQREIKISKNDMPEDLELKILNMEHQINISKSDKGNY